MTEIHAKPVVDGKFWIVEQDENKVGVLKLNEQRKYIFSSKDTVTVFDNKKKLFETFGTDFFVAKTKKTEVITEDKEIHGYPTSASPYNPMFDVKRHLPLFTKSNKSKSVYCAGYYIIKFDKGWVKSFCPKLITIERYQYEGPFKTELEMKQRLNNANR
jgi:alpha-acetolactate decarboxylase